MLNRRRFVETLIGLGVVGWAGSAQAAAPLPRTTRRVRIDGPPSRAVFAALVGDTFRITLDRRVVLLTLVEVTEGPVSLGTEQFTLVFRGPRELVVRDGLYVVRHPTAGSARMFLQPGNDDEFDGFCEASFNLMR
jgi:hypothetical protein